MHPTSNSGYINGNQKKMEIVPDSYAGQSSDIDDMARGYLREIGDYPLLKHTEEREMIVALSELRETLDFFALPLVPILSSFEFRYKGTPIDQKNTKKISVNKIKPLSLVPNLHLQRKKQIHQLKKFRQ